MLSVQSGFLHPAAPVERATRRPKEKKINLWVSYAATREYKEVGKSILNTLFLSKINCFSVNFTRLSTGCADSLTSR